MPTSSGGVAGFSGKLNDNSILNTNRCFAISTAKPPCGSAVCRLYNASLSIWPIVHSLFQAAFYGPLNSQFLLFERVLTVPRGPAGARCYSFLHSAQAGCVTHPVPILWTQQRSKGVKLTTPI